MLGLINKVTSYSLSMTNISVGFPKKESKKTLTRLTQTDKQTREQTLVLGLCTWWLKLGN